MIALRSAALTLFRRAFRAALASSVFRATMSFLAAAKRSVSTRALFAAFCASLGGTSSFAGDPARDPWPASRMASAALKAVDDPTSDLDALKDLTHL